MFLYSTVGRVRSEDKWVSRGPTLPWGRCPKDRPIWGHMPIRVLGG